MTQSRPNLQYVYYHYLIMYCYICDWLHFLIIIKNLKICHLSFFDKACNCLYQFVGKTFFFHTRICIDFFLRIFPKKVWIINVPKLFRGNVIAKQSESKRSCPRFDYADISTTVKGGWQNLQYSVQRRVVLVLVLGCQDIKTGFAPEYDA